jgi:ABC-type Fe3+-hydroxamate transport system substrate-binding protein
VVSLVPSLTELLSDLGLDDEVVGLTTFCVRPAEWRDAKTRIGGTKQVALPRLLALAPDLVVANKEENTRADVEAIAAHVPVYVTDIASLDEALAAIVALGEVLGRPALAGALAEEIAEAFAGLPPWDGPARVAYLIWRDPWMVAGGGTFIDDLLGRAGLRNVFGDRPRYPAVSLEALREAAPDALLLSSEPFPFKPVHAAELGAALPGVRVVHVDGEAFSWYGSRLRHTPAAIAGLRAALAAARPGG